LKISRFPLHHFIANSEWDVEQLRRRRLEKLKRALNGRAITIIIDETGDRKKGKTTDYVARQYLGSIGKIDNGIVSVNAYGLYKDVTFPLLFKVFKPESRLKIGDEYKTKIELATEIITEVIDVGFKIELIVADSLYGEASQFIKKISENKLDYVVAIRSNHGVFLPPNQRVRANKWCKFTRTFSNHKSEMRYVREIIYGKRQKITYWELTTDPETMPENATSFVMTNLQEKLKEVLGDLYGSRTWVEYGFRQCKQELGWTDYRFTDFQNIEKWWEIIFCAYTMISLKSTAFLSSLASCQGGSSRAEESSHKHMRHEQWDHKNSWKSTLNNLRLIIQPLLVCWLMYPWLRVFPFSWEHPSLSMSNNAHG
jgi:SRSO17 transposase